MRILVSLLFVFISTILNAHQTGLSYVDIVEDENAKIDIVYKKPLGDTQADDIFIRYPVKCTQTQTAPKTISDGFVVSRYSLWCGEDGLKDSRIWVDGLVSSDRGVMIRYEKNSVVESGLLRSSTPFIHINHKLSKFELFVEYVDLGVVHIWVGYDHLLFVLGLFLLAANMKILLFAITGFTLSHSITLAFGILGVATIPIVYVEAMIALSIVFLARELLVNNLNSFTRKHLSVVAFIFGLLHGFGFSSVLASIGLPQDEIPLSLFAFNLGIEIGQVLFILAIALLFSILKKYIQKYQNNIERYSAYFIGAFSTFWLIERLASI